MLKKILNIRLLIVLFLGFASGLPLALTGQSMQAWLTVDKIDMATIGFFSLVGIPYTFKFLWAPLMDRFELPFLVTKRLASDHSRFTCFNFVYPFQSFTF